MDRAAAHAFVEHGGRLDRAAALYPHAPGPWIDLSTGINPVAWRPREPLAIDLARLPSPEALAALEAAAAGSFGAPPDAVVAVPGSELALRLLAQCGLPGPVRHGVPGYRTHGEAFGASMPVAIEGARADRGTLVLANPNNPDGRVLSPDAVRALAGEGWLIVDEAYAEAVPGASIVPALPERTIVLRSFGKFFGLAGVRLGFAVAPRGIVVRLRALLGSWPVSATAIAYGTAAYRDADWIAATQVRLTADAAAFDAMLARQGLVAQGACPLFRLVESERPLFETLARAGILVRPFADAPGRVRFGVPADAAALARVEAALAHG